MDAAVEREMRRNLTRIETGACEVFIDLELPVALIRHPEGDRIVTWPGAKLPPAAFAATVVSSPNTCWVLYRAYGIANLREVEEHVTAVAIGLDGSVTDFDLGRVSVFGADEIGLWVERMADVQQRDGDSWGPPDPDTLPLLTAEEWHERPPAKAAPVALGEPGQIGFVGARGIFSPLVPPVVPDGPHEQPSRPTDMVRYRLDGNQDNVRVNRQVWSVEQSGSDLRIAFLAGEPNPASGQALNNNWVSTVVVDPFTQIPAEILVEDYGPSSPEYYDVLAAMIHYVEFEEDRHDVELPRVEWTLRNPGPQVISDVTQWTVDSLERQAEPGIWSRGGTWARVQSDFTQMAVRVEGGWPSTVVVAEFTNRHWPGETVRLRQPVFDRAGLPAVTQYLTTYLDESLETSRPDRYPRSEDGFVEMTVGIV